MSCSQQKVQHVLLYVSRDKDTGSSRVKLASALTVSEELMRNIWNMYSFVKEMEFFLSWRNSVELEVVIASLSYSVYIYLLSHSCSIDCDSREFQRDNISDFLWDLSSTYATWAKYDDVIVVSVVLLGILTTTPSRQHVKYLTLKPNPPHPHSPQQQSKINWPKPCKANHLGVAFSSLGECQRQSILAATSTREL